MPNNPVSAPHEFAPLRWWDNWSAAGRCRACVAPRVAHEDIVLGKLWMRARAIGDKSKSIPFGGARGRGRG